MTQSKIHFIHSADMQFGAKFGNLPPDLAELKRASQRESFSALVSLALKKKVQLFLIAGDMFETEHPSFAEVAFVKKELKRLDNAGIFVFVVPGNHDPYSEDNFWDEQQPWPITHLFTSESFETFYLENLDLEIVGRGFDRNKSSKNVLKNFNLTMRGERSVMLFHGAWQNFGRELDRDYPFATEDLAKIPCNYIALGHYHGFTEVLSDTHKKACYSGDVEGLDFSKGELGKRFAVYGTIDTSGEVSLEPLPLPSMAMEAIELDVSEASLVGIDQALQQKADPKSLMQLTLMGIPPVEIISEISSLPQHFESFFAYLEIKDKTVGIPDTDLKDDHTYRGLFYRAIKEKMATTESDEEKQILKQALALGLGAFTHNT